jgi:hypothetical protein
MHMRLIMYGMKCAEISGDQLKRAVLICLISSLECDSYWFQKPLFLQGRRLLQTKSYTGRQIYSRSFSF